MDVWANRLVGKSSLRRKQLGYFRARELRRFATQWGFKSFRVLVVTTSEERIQSMLRSQQRAAANCPPGFFLYSTFERLARHGALGPAWTTIKTDKVSLLHTEHVATPISDHDSAPSLRAAGIKRESHDMPYSRA
jgi:hypothetical protein